MNALPAEFMAQRAVLRAIGTGLARRWAGAQDQSALIDDLEGEGWLVVVQIGADHPRIRWEIRNAHMNYLARMLYGVVRSHSRTRGPVVVQPLDGLPLASNEMTPLQVLLFKEYLAQRLGLRAHRPARCRLCRTRLPRGSHDETESSRSCAPNPAAPATGQDTPHVPQEAPHATPRRRRRASFDRWLDRLLAQHNARG